MNDSCLVFNFLYLSVVVFVHDMRVGDTWSDNDVLFCAIRVIWELKLLTNNFKNNIHAYLK